MFVPYNPRLLRACLFLCAVLCVALGAWALVTARTASGTEAPASANVISAWARVGVTAGLLGAFAWISWRIRPRSGWGVKVEPRGLSIARTLSGEPMELEWDDLQEIRFAGVRRDRLLILLRPEGRVLLQRHLFADRQTFEKLAGMLSERAPTRAHDA